VEISESGNLQKLKWLFEKNRKGTTYFATKIALSEKSNRIEMREESMGETAKAISDENFYFPDF